MIQVTMSNEYSVGTNGNGVLGAVNWCGAKIEHNSRPLLAASARVVFQDGMVPTPALDQQET